MKYNRKSIENENSYLNARTSCGGTLNVAVRKSTLMIVSTQGRIKNKPGPLAPPKQITKPVNYPNLILIGKKKILLFTYLVQYDQGEE
jgi:hypothetical protein